MYAIAFKLKPLAIAIRTMIGEATARNQKPIPLFDPSIYREASTDWTEEMESCVSFVNESRAPIIKLAHGKHTAEILDFNLILRYEDAWQQRFELRQPLLQIEPYLQ
ncbi:MAG: hypothetical protein ACRCWJ_20500 [Casimicrobium sp.]